VRNEEVLYRVKEERNILHTIKRRKANWIGHILRRNCLLKHVIEGKLEGRIEMTGRRGRRRKQLLDDLKENRGYWKLKEEALDRSQWRSRFGRGYGPVVRQTTEWMKTERQTSRHLKTDRQVCKCKLLYIIHFNEWAGSVFEIPRLVSTLGHGYSTIITTDIVQLLARI
jgi:hypothetical protein